MKKILQKNRKRFAVIRLQFPNARNGFVCSNRTGQYAISNNGNHYGILYNGRVYCNIYPEGLPESQWISSFYDWTYRRPKVIKQYF